LVDEGSAHKAKVLSGFRPATIKKIYIAYKQTSKANQQLLDDVEGKRAPYKLLERMAYPYTGIGLLVMEHGTDRGFCTGWLVSAKVVATAAHCVFDLDTMLPLSPDDIRFMPRV
jgi:hypothetical protein